MENLISSVINEILTNKHKKKLTYSFDGNMFFFVCVIFHVIEGIPFYYVITNLLFIGS